MKEQEQAYAIQEGHRNKAENEYFAARPQIDSGDRRNVFDAGFDRGYLAASTPLLERIAQQQEALQEFVDNAHVQDAGGADFVVTTCEALEKATTALQHKEQT